MPQPARSALRVSPSGIRTITNRALALPGVIRLEIGEPNFPTPPHIVEAADRAARDGFTHYTHTQGLLSLREAWSERLTSVNGCSAEPARLIVTAGAVSGLYAAFCTVLEPGDEILLPDPGWPNWTMMAALLGAKPVRYASDARSGWQPDLEAMGALVTDRTKALLVNSPGNPTGAVLDETTMAQLAQFARQHDLWLISDECYDAIVFDGEHVGAAAFDDDGRTITVVSCSKTYAMTGWRVGCVCPPAALVPSLVRVQQATLASVCSITQKAAEAALLGPQDCVAAMRGSYRARRDQALALLAKLGRAAAPPGGAFYAMVDLSDVIADSTAFAMELLERERVAVAPGSAFGSAGARSVRVALCVSEDDLDRGLRSVVAAAERSRATLA